MSSIKELRAATFQMDSAIDDIEHNLVTWIQEAIDALEGDEPDVDACVSELKDIISELRRK